MNTFRLPSYSSLHLQLLSFFFVLLSMVSSAKKPMECYMCNSELNPRCKDDYHNLNYFCLNKTLHGKDVQAIGCRVINSYVGGDSIVVRECAFSGENVESRRHKGSFAVSYVYSQCSRPKCNSSMTLYSFCSILLLTVVALFHVQ